MRSVIEVNPWCSYDEIEAKTLLSRGTIFNIIHDCLKLKKVTSRWVPHQLIEENRQDRVRICQEVEWRGSPNIFGERQDHRQC